MATKNSNLYSADGSFVPGPKVSGRLRAAWSHSALDQANGDTFTTAKIPADARMVEASIVHPSSGIMTVNIGTNRDGTLFASGVSLGTIKGSWENYRFENADFATMGQRIWKQEGLATNPGDNDMIITTDLNAQATEIGFLWLYAND